MAKLLKQVRALSECCVSKNGQRGRFIHAESAEILSFDWVLVTERRLDYYGDIQVDRYFKPASICIEVRKTARQVLADIGISRRQHMSLAVKSNWAKHSSTRIFISN
jgi:hypothetical protein